MLKKEFLGLPLSDGATLYALGETAIGREFSSWTSGGTIRSLYQSTMLSETIGGILSVARLGRPGHNLSCAIERSRIDLGADCSRGTRNDQACNKSAHR